MPNKRKAAFFLDRDGTINVDHVYINNPVHMELIPGAAKAIARIREAGYLVVVVTNQSGVGRGIIDPLVLPKIHRRMEELLRSEDPGAIIDHYEICVHSPEQNCDCRKPSAKLVEHASSLLNLDLLRSVFIGDKLTDVATGNRAGCGHSFLVRTGKGKKEETLLRDNPEDLPQKIFDDLSQAVDWFFSPHGVD